MSDLTKRLRYYAKRGTGVGPEELLVYATALEQLQAALVEINQIIFAVGAPLGSDRYFEIRKIVAAAEVEKFKDEWYSPAHMDAVQARTIDPQRKRIKQLEAALIESDNGHIRCLVCHNETYAGQMLLHKSGCLLSAKVGIDI